jgi:hypothetical protein
MDLTQPSTLLMQNQLAEIDGSQKSSSAIKRSAEPFEHPISWAIRSEFGQERTLRTQQVQGLFSPSRL